MAAAPAPTQTQVTMLTREFCTEKAVMAAWKNTNPRMVLMIHVRAIWHTRTKAIDPPTFRMPGNSFGAKSDRRMRREAPPVL